MKDYLKACWQLWLDMWFLNVGCSVFTLLMWHFAARFSWSVSFVVLAALLVYVTFIPEGLCRLERRLRR